MEDARRLQLIQIFRGLAATLVVFYHATTVGGTNLQVYFLNNLFHFGHCGVDFFFVLSGFIILHAHYEQAGKRGRIPAYLTARFIRIFPIYWIMMAAYLVFYWHHPERNVPTLFDWDTLARAFVLYDQSNEPVVPVAWTLTYELVFYLFFTLYFVVGRAIFGLMTLAWVALVFAEWAGGLRTGHLVLMRPVVLQFLVGCLAAALAHRFPPARTGRWVVLAGLLFAAVGMAEVEEFLGEYETIRHWTIPCFLLILAAACYDKGGRRQYPKTLLLLGDASYVIYLLHYLVLLVLIEAHIAHPWPTNPRLPLVLYIGVTLWIGVLIHRWIERPLLGALRRRLLPVGGASGA